MSPNYSSLHRQLIAAMTAALPKAANSAAKEFVTYFYRSATVQDLSALEPKHATEIARLAQAFAAQRPKSGPKIEITPVTVREKKRDQRRTQLLVLNDDMPFLVDSLSGLFTSLGLSIHRVLHPVLDMARDGKGALNASGKTQSESLIYAELSPLPAELSAAQLEEKMRLTLQHVAHAVADWKIMHEQTLALSQTFKHAIKNVSPEDTLEAHDLLHWLAAKHFVFLGMADYRANSKGDLQLDAPSALGIYRLPANVENAIERGPRFTASETVSVFKGSDLSLVHRVTPLDYIAVRRYDTKGALIGETRILGLFTSTVYYRETDHIPFIRRRAATILKRAGFAASGHSGKTLKATLEFLPRDELFQMDEERLFHMTMGIVALDAKPQVKLFVRHDPFDRFISAMVYIPRERFSSDLREAIVRLLERAYHGRYVTFGTQLGESPLARLTLLIETTPGAVPVVDETALEAQIAGRTNLWAEALHETLLTTSGEEDGPELAQSFANAFTLPYINTHSAAQAVHDIRRAMECLRGDGLALELFRAEAPAVQGQLHLKCFTRDVNSELSTIIPLLENMGCTVVDATPYVVSPLPPLSPLLLRDVTLRVPGAESLNLAQHKARIESAISLIWRGLVDNDTLNALVFSAELSARDIEILRAYSRYLQQLDFPYSQSFIAAALNAHAATANDLVALFHARFHPEIRGREEKSAAITARIEAALENVSNLAEDRIIRRFLALIQASLRTNFFQTDAAGNAKPYLSIKLRSAAVPEMPQPVPYAEIFVTSMRVEGIHLRGGPVARGGLRWSDRPEDFRTEILGLMKTQMVKNAVIVPQGAKGGFILRRAPAERDALMAEGIACYQIFLRGLLDITDNLAGTEIIPPSHVVRHDADDPYLVVAADKGTASFSDIANGISGEYGFWLGDAFASGGSAGYDHKIMAITARGGWVSVERHFREMGRDIGRDTFTAIGVGDMSGDVFGNGALLSANMRLIAAFNHRHIFIDPTPDAASSFAERTRLFALPRSGWNDYNTALISKGGGVFERTAKSIKLSSEIRAALDTSVTQATPDELIRLILKAPVDLLWNGGIGTYVKAAFETNDDVGDRTNNALRINGGDLRCKIVGEGGNLGFTQAGRIEYARRGGRINTDAIDNSGGVDCSDHEVNIKIALRLAVDSKRLNAKKRDALLKTMTEEVADLVLLDNRLQTQAISIAEAQGAGALEPAAQLMAQLEATGFLNRDIEALPSAHQIGELRTAKRGLARPEIAVLQAYAKMDFYNRLKDAELLDGPYFESDLLRYFPKVMQKSYAGEIRAHRLRRSIVATMITNSIVNRAGFAFAHSLMRDTGLAAIDVAQAYVATRDAFGLRELWAMIETLDGKTSAALQSQLFSRVNRFIEHSCRWFLTHLPQPMALDSVFSTYVDAIAVVEKKAESLMSETLRKSFHLAVDELLAQAVPAALAVRIAKLEIMASACDIADIARARKLTIEQVGRLYFELGATLKLGWLRRSARELVADNYWQELAVKSLIVELYHAQRRLTQDVLARYGNKKAEPMALWAEEFSGPLARFLQFIGELRMQPSLDYPMLIVALRQVQGVTTL
ncbi:MAG: NAD-glutamate dehydrogenase [Rickettsiales bacterium]